MNVGQILEAHLGWAAKGLGEQLQQMLEKEFSTASLREWLRKIYNSDRFSAYLKDLTDDELRRSYGNACRRVPRLSRVQRSDGKRDQGLPASRWAPGARPDDAL